MIIRSKKAQHIRNEKPINVKLAQIIPLHSQPDRMHLTHEDTLISPLMQYLMPSSDGNVDTKYISGDSKKLLRDVWGNVTKVQGSDTLFVKTERVQESDLTKLKSLGLITSVDGNSVELTPKGDKVLKESILCEESSLASTRSKYKLESSRFRRNNFKVGQTENVAYTGAIVDYAIPLPSMDEKQHYGNDGDMPVLVIRKHNDVSHDSGKQNKYRVGYTQMTLNEAVRRMKNDELVPFSEANAGSAGTFSGGGLKPFPQNKWKSNWPGEDDE